MIRTLFLLTAFSLSAALAQESTEPEADTAADTPAAVKAETPDIDADVDLDELYPVEDEDAFIPSENVAFGQSIPFPTDI